MYVVLSRTHTPPGPLSQTCVKLPSIVWCSQPCRVGADVGVKVGAAVGVAVGDTDGLAVGLCDGLAVGAVLGLAVGEAVGAALGAVVGDAVGATVSSHRWLWCLLSQPYVHMYPAPHSHM